MKTGGNKISNKKRKKNRNWMTDELFNMMYNYEYRRMNREINNVKKLSETPKSQLC